jgi:hypothetical protein
MSAPFAHIGGVPVEETLGSLGPALLVAFGVASTRLRALVRAVRSRAAARRHAGDQDAHRTGLSRADSAIARARAHYPA